MELGLQRHAGVTLLELIITVAVIAVLLAVVAPSFNDFFDKNRLKQATEDIYGLIMRAKAETVTRDANMFVNVDADAWCVGFAAAANCTCSPLPDPGDAGACAVPVAGVNVLQVIDGANFTGVDITSANTGIEFNRLRGTTFNNRTVSLTSGAWSLNIVVSQDGRIRLCAPDAGRTMGYPQC